MNKTNSELFRAFLAGLRDSGTEIPLPDNEVAIMISSALDILSPDSDEVAEAATALANDFDVLAIEIHHQILIEEA